MRQLRFAFAALSVSAAVGAVAAQAAAAPLGAYTTKGAGNYVSVPNLHPPMVHTDAPTAAKKLAGGYFMLANFKDLTQSKPMVGQSGPLILNSKLQVVWFDPVPENELALNLREQTYNGQPVLTWFQGPLNSTGTPLPGSEDVVVNQHYKQIATLQGQDGWTISEHEMVISGSNAWVTAYKVLTAAQMAAETNGQTPANYGGSPTGTFLDSAVQEYSLSKPGHPLEYTWDPLRYVSLSQSQTRPAPNGAAPWDAYHVNSIQLTGNGTFLVSLRNTWAAYLVKEATGGAEWTLGGKASTYTFGPGAQFQWQHDVQLNKNNTVSLFDDACCAIEGVNAQDEAVFGPTSGPSRGLTLKLGANHTATLVHQYSRGSHFNAAFLGSTQLLPNGNVVVGWGSRPYFSEYTAGGTRLLDAVFPSPDISYRAYVQNWVGTPYFAPKGAARTKKGKATVYATWDGATKVTGWRVLAGSSAKHLTAVATVGKGGFETAIHLSKVYKVYKVQALGAKGHVLGTSAAFSAPSSGTKTTSGGSSGSSGGSGGYGGY